MTRHRNREEARRRRTIRDGRRAPSASEVAPTQARYEPEIHRIMASPPRPAAPDGRRIRLVLLLRHLPGIERASWRARRLPHGHALRVRADRLPFPRDGRSLRLGNPALLHGLLHRRPPDSRRRPGPKHIPGMARDRLDSHLLDQHYPHREWQIHENLQRCRLRRPR
jgi:hypothetical protein